MPILRNPRKRNFTVIANYALRDEKLSLKARGLLASIMSFPDDWQFSEQGLYKVFPKDGLASIKSGLKELEEGRYLIRTQVRGENGKLGNSVWTISDYPMCEKPSTEKPLSENPLTVNPSTGKPLTGNQGQLNNDLLKNDRLSNDGLKKEGPAPQADTQRPPRKRFSPPSVEEVRAYCQSRQNGVDPQRFVDWYQANGWKVGKNPMKDWKAAVRTWESRNGTRQNRAAAGNPFMEMLREEERCEQNGNFENYVSP